MDDGRRAVATTGSGGGATAMRPVLENIEAVARLEREAAARRSPADRIADAVAGAVGTVWFVAAHLLLFAAWAALNTGLVPGVPAFDPYPFSLLCMIVSMEGVLLSAFVLIKQNREGARAEERAHLALQVNLLAEKEATKILAVLEAVAERVGVGPDPLGADGREMARVTAVGEVARQLRERLPDDA